MLVQQDTLLNKNSYYEATASRGIELAPLEENIKADVCIVGAGFSGLSAAIELRLQGYEVVVLEAQRVGWGASGRNGGQVIVGYADDASIAKKLTPTDAKQAWEMSVEAVQLLRDRIEKYAIDCDWQTGFMHVATTAKKAQALEQKIHTTIADYAYPHYTFINHDKMPEMIKSERYFSGVYDSFSGHLHPLNYVLGLARVAQQLGVRIYEQTAALSMNMAQIVQINTAKACVRSEYVLLAGNVYLNDYNHQLAPKLTNRILAVGTYVTATEVLDEGLVNDLIPCQAAICDTNVELDYFRFTSDRRMLFGGDVTFGGKIPSDYAERVRQRMCMTFPELRDASIAYTWGGHVDMTMNLAPDFGRLAPNVYYLQGFSGHGVALTGMAGKLVAQAIAGQAERFDVFTRIHHRRFIGGKLMRTPTLMIGMLYHRLLELLGKN